MSSGTCPAGMSLREWQLALRRQAGGRGGFDVAELSGRWAPGRYTVTSHSSHRVYRVSYHGEGSEWNNCECMDFRTSSLGTCKHLEAVASWLRSNGREPAGDVPSRPMLYISYTGGRRLRLHPGDKSPAELQVAALRFFDDDLVATPGMVPELPSFIENARRIDPRFHCMPDALNYILEARDRRRRSELMDDLSSDRINSLLRTTLYPYQAEGIRFAFEAGKVLVADEMGLGKTVQAIGTAELYRQNNMAASVLIVCPTSLKYQWKKEIERFTGAEAVVIEGVHTRRRELYSDEAYYKIVSYHTLANDIKVFGTLRFDMLIMDEVQRLKNWNTQISQAARRIESDYSVILSGTPLENRPEELYSVMQFVDQYALGPYHEFVDRHVTVSPTGRVTGYRNLAQVSARLKGCMIRRRRSEVEIQLPERTDKILYVPVTPQQSALHDECRSVVARLVGKWQRYRFLSEKDRKRLLMLLSRMRMVCDSTFVVDQSTRSDTKVSEALQLVKDVIESGDEKIVIFSQWERMTRIVAEELDRASIRYEYLHGSVSAGRRRNLTDSFNTDPDVRVFLSTDAGSTGLNLQAASIVINLDLPWNPAVLEQRISRVFRMGQRRNVQVINMVSAGTIEERMLSTLEFKNDLFAGIFDGGEDEITLSDGRLTLIAEAIAEMLPPDEVQACAEPDEESDAPVPEVAPAAENAAARQPEPSALIGDGVKFLSGLASTLSSPEATEALVSRLVGTDPATGGPAVIIPVESRESVTAFFNAISKLICR